MRRYNIVLLILLILSIINFGLAAPALIPDKSQVCVDVVHVSKDMKTILGKRGGMLGKMANLFEYLDRWWGRNPGLPSTIRPPSSSAPLEASHGSMQEHTPPASPASSTSEWGPVSDLEDESIPSLESLPKSVWDPVYGSKHVQLPGSVFDSDHEFMPSSESDTESMPSLVTATDDEGLEGLDHESMDVDHDTPPPSQSLSRQ